MRTNSSIVMYCYCFSNITFSLSLFTLLFLLLLSSEEEESAPVEVPPCTALFSVENPIIPCVPSQKAYSLMLHTYTRLLHLQWKMIHLLNSEDFQRFLVPYHLPSNKGHLEEVESLAFLLLLNDCSLLLFLCLCYCRYYFLIPMTKTIYFYLPNYKCYHPLNIYHFINSST